MRLVGKYFFLLCLFCTVRTFSQNEITKWYFGYYGALDFMTNPPTPLNNSAMNAVEGCSSIADANGNLLFYTNGVTIWNAAHTQMANGTGLNGNTSATQGALIIRRPGSANLFYVFTLSFQQFCYSIVDMSLAAGMGSVTVKNALIYNNNNSLTTNLTEKMHATRHANGSDFWVAVREYNNLNVNGDFRTYHLSAAGLNTTAVISAVGTPTNTNFSVIGQMKFSPNGQKLGFAYYNGNNNIYPVAELYDFNNATGVVSNPVPLYNYTTTINNFYYSYGCEFSPDNSKFYVARYANSGLNQIGITQWDMNAGSASAIQASSIAIATNTNTTNNNYYFGSMQLAPNGKIYISGYYSSTVNTYTNLSVINNPNAAGTACNFVYGGQPFGLPNPNANNQTSYSYLSLPNFIPQPCLTFTAGTGNITGCFGASAGSASVLAVAANSGTLTYLWNNGTNTYSTPIITNVPAGAWTVTVSDTTNCSTSSVVTIAQPPATTITITASSQTVCVNGSAVLTASAAGGTGSFGFLWQNFLNSNIYTPSQNTQGTYVYTVLATDQNLCSTTKTIAINFLDNPTLGALPNQTICTAQSATLVASGASTYTWQPMNVASSSVVVSPTALTIYTVIGTGTNQCSTSKTLAVSFYTNPILNVSPNQTICSNQSATLNASGASVYTWQPLNVISNSIVVSPTAPITIYTVSATNNGCATEETVAVNYYANPSLVVTPSQSVCPSFSANLNVSGANTYTWQPNNVVSNAITVSPPSTNVYTVTGTGTGNCQSTETVQVFVFPLPTLSFNTYSITCANLGSATVTPIGGYGVYNYTWQPSNQFAAVALNLNPNTYTVTVRDVNTNCVVDSSVTFSSPIPLTGNLNYQNILHCNSVNTGTAYFSNLAGGSGTENYIWSSATNTYTNALPNNLHAATWSVTVGDALTGCQIFSVFTVTQPPAVTLNIASTSQSICTAYNVTLTATAGGGTGNLHFKWNGAAGSISVVSPPVGTHIFTSTVNDDNNCSTNNTIAVHVVPPPNLSIALSSPSVCAHNFSGSQSIITLTANGASTYTLNTPSHIAVQNLQNAVWQLNAVAPYLPTGITAITLYGSNGVCTVSSTPNFSIIPNPTVSVNNVSPAICAGESFAYVPQGASSYTWTCQTQNATIYNSGNMAITSPSVNSIFSVLGEQAGCFSTLQTVSITVNPIPQVYISPKDTSICLNAVLTLTAKGTANSTYVWFPSNNTGNQLYVNPTDLQTKTYTVLATFNNCTNSAMATVAVNPLPTAKFDVLKTPKCVNDSLILRGKGGMGYFWTLPNNVTVAGEELRIKVTSIAYSGVYILKVNDIHGCSDTEEKTIHVNALPTGHMVNQNMQGCVPLCNNFSFAPLSSSQTSIVAVSWQVGKKTISTENHFYYCFNTAGNYTLTANLKDQNNCLNTLSSKIIVYPKPLADFDFSPKEPVENIDEVQFTSTSKNAKKITWEFSNNNQTSQYENASMLFETAGDYAVALVAESENYCKDTVVKIVNVLTDFAIYIPNAFTPNGDNLNETFKPVTRGALQYRFQIFNRWGDKIFETTDVNIGWDGTFKGQACEATTYVWKLLVSGSKEEKSMTGTVLLQN